MLAGVRDSLVPVPKTAEVSARHAELSGHFGTSLMVQKYLGVSWVRSILTLYDSPK